ncbi:MAG: ParB/RepB/Spo0J family partition protein [Candidatus Accumulibacter sp. UW20]|jgi:ParB family chromosome partitioning protein
MSTQGAREDARLKNAMSPGKPRQHVKEVADEIFGITPRPLPAEQIVEIPLDRIKPSPFQVRSLADAAYVDQLAESIRENGLVAPVIVRKLLDSNNLATSIEEGLKLLESNNFELVAGHHRVEACRVLGIPTVKGVIRELSDTAAALSLTIDNAVRKNLTDFERFKHISMLERTGACRTQDSVARALGVSQPLISNLKSYASLPPEALTLLESAPDVLGSTYAAQLKPFCQSHPLLVTEAIGLLVAGSLRQSRAVLWLSHRITAPRRDPHRLGITLRHGETTARLVVSTGKAELVANGLNLAAVEKLIRAHLAELIESPD